MTDFEAQLAHSTQQAMQPGFWQYAKQAVADLEADRGYHGMYSGLRSAVGASIRAAGYRPAPHELAELWIEKKKEEMK